MVMSHPCMSHR